MIDDEVTLIGRERFDELLATWPARAAAQADRILAGVAEGRKVA